jgi:glycosyltransferase involved in cell wall biosynthesis
MLSVIIPARDVGPFIEESVRSALAQTARDLEVLVVDDGSRDDTRARVAGIADTRLRLLTGQGRGAAAARNQAMAVARGEYIAFLDADDIWLPGHAERLLSRLERRPDLDLVFAASAWIDEFGRPIARSVVRWQGTIGYRALFLEFVPVTMSAVLVRRSVVEHVGGSDETMRAGSDHDLCLRVALLRPDNCLGVPDVGVYYRRRTGQITSNRRDKQLCWQRLVAKHRALAPESVTALEAAATANHQRALAALAYESGAYAEARSLLVQALRSAPTTLVRDRRTWFMLAAAIASFLPAPLRLRIEKAGAALLHVEPRAANRSQSEIR